MKTKLIVPQNEEVIAKSLGAEFDKEKREWYVEDVEDLQPFLRWMSQHLLRPCKPVICTD